MKWIAYCPAVDDEYRAFESTFESDALPRPGDEICLEQEEFCCEMLVLHCTWHLVDGRLVPTVQLEPRAACKVSDFIGLGWKLA